MAVKKRRLQEILVGLDSAIVAFSGGVDSAYLAFEAASVLGDRAVAVTADSPSYPAHHRDLAVALANRLGLRHEFISTGEMERPEYRANPANRCYYCKQELFGTLTTLARERGIAAVLDGSNADDRGDYRPGRQAAREYGVRSPLDEAELHKEEIRALSRDAGLPGWDEPSSACLSSRIPYDSEVTEDKLRAIEAAEDVLRALGFRHCRGRHHGDVARIEVARSDMVSLTEKETSDRVCRKLKALGFRYVSLDLEGYRTGSLNEGLILRPV
ncbi:MAG: ATP-dependent sacrificial sulfur transferase LarE [Acidobacteria bacterium]|nr:MAG: ATP-dependent sacrificial sulfur transferase LarE [Acidobacteriota bacterium]RPJ84829.1 MAG: ATP-dependent sacrificial sulfur transferase LarE [Acidobacteriota bacterium]